MQSITDRYLLARELTLRTPTGEPLVVKVEELSLTELDDAFTECRLTLKVSPELYQRIDTGAFFNLKSEFRHQMMEGNFFPEKDIEIQVRLTDDLLSHLSAQAYSAETVAEHLFRLKQNYLSIKSPLLFTENWYGLQVKQSIDLPPGLEGEFETGYSTIWNDKPDDDKDDNVNSLAEAMVDFFTAREWPFDTEASPLNQDETFFRLLFQGDNGQWRCFAYPRESQHQCVFYSVYPELIPEERRMAVAEFLTQANFGMVIGNFEINLDTGKIRFKTSIDVEGEHLTMALLLQLIAANVNTMDQYLFSIQRIVVGELGLEAAIAQPEG